MTNTDTDTDNYPVRKERTLFRCAEYSAWHRELGFNCPQLDIDFVEHIEGTVENAWLEYDRNVPVAIIETKAHFQQLDFSNSQLQTLGNLGTMSGLPFFTVQYDSKAFTKQGYSGTFRFTVANEIAVDTAKAISQKPDPIVSLYQEYTLSERQYVHVLYALRGREVPREIKARLNG